MKITNWQREKPIPSTYGTVEAWLRLGGGERLRIYYSDEDVIVVMVWGVSSGDFEDIYEGKSEKQAIRVAHSYMVGFNGVSFSAFKKSLKSKAKTRGIKMIIIDPNTCLSCGVSTKKDVDAAKKLVEKHVEKGVGK